MLFAAAPQLGLGGTLLIAGILSTGLFGALLYEKESARQTTKTAVVFMCSQLGRGGAFFVHHFLRGVQWTILKGRQGIVWLFVNGWQATRWTLSKGRQGIIWMFVNRQRLRLPSPFPKRRKNP